MRSFLKNNRVYLSLYLLGLLSAAYFLLQFDKVEIHVKINSLVGNHFVDIFFKYFTHFGDGVVAIIMAIIVLLTNARNGVYILITYLVSGAITSILKNFVFNDNRPHFMFGFYLTQYKINYVEGVEMLGLNSFPSGHATTSFAVYTALALITKNKALKLTFFCMAFLSAFSRTYLSQHWLVDITVGSFIGTVAAIVFYFVFIQADKLQKLNKPLMNLFKS